jgi:hypothetical protein
VITRVWRGWAPADRAQEHERHYRSAVLPVLRSVAGFEGARLLRRTTGDETEPRELLARFDERSQHYEVRERRIP